MHRSDFSGMSCAGPVLIIQSTHMHTCILVNVLNDINTQSYSLGTGGRGWGEYCKTQMDSMVGAVI